MRRATIAGATLGLVLAGGRPAGGEEKTGDEAAPPKPPPLHEGTAVDGDVFRGRLLDGDAAGLRLLADGRERTIDPRRLVSVRLRPYAAREAGGPFNLYLANGDRLNGTVAGGGDRVSLAGRSGTRLEAPLSDVRAVRFGRLLGALQAKYDRTFQRALERGRDVVIVLRDAKPYPQPGRVLHVGEKRIAAWIAGQRREIEAGRVYGFVRAVEEPGRPKDLAVRVHLEDGGRATLGFERLGDKLVEGREGAVPRVLATRLEFGGDHLAHLSDFDPIRVEQVVLFGEPPRWRRDRMVLGGPLRVDGRTYDRGVGVHAHTTLEFVLGRRWSALFVRCGIDDAAGDEGAAVFRVLADGKVLAEVRRASGDPPRALNLDVTGVDRLVLEALPGDSYISDFCDWAEARVYR